MITLTVEAAKEIVRMSENADSGKLLRIFIEPGGCSGFEYGMSMDLPKPSDNLGESQGVQFAGGRRKCGISFGYGNSL
jgi:iron-sulfur cluster assembly protein/iron-sulfur cluster insertion protein